MKNDEIRNALGSAATLMRMIAKGNQPENMNDRLRLWADRLEQASLELLNRQGAKQELIDAFAAWQSQEENGIIN